jgi:hypothetical protein
LTPGPSFLLSKSRQMRLFDRRRFLWFSQTRADSILPKRWQTTSLSTPLTARPWCSAFLRRWRPWSIPIPHTYLPIHHPSPLTCNCLTEPIHFRFQPRKLSRQKLIPSRRLRHQLFHGLQLLLSHLCLFRRFRKLFLRRCNLRFQLRKIIIRTADQNCEVADPLIQHCIGGRI